MCGVRVLEEDDTSPNDPSRFQDGARARPGRHVSNGRDKPLEWTFEDGEYHFTFMLRKRANAPVK